MTRRFLFTLLLLLMPMFPNAHAQQQPRGKAPATAQRAKAQAPRAGKVGVRVLVVHATSAHSRVDSRLANLTRFLSHLRYTGYDLLGTHNAQLASKGKQTFSIEGGSKVTVELLSKDDRRVRLRVQMTRGSSKLLDTTLSVNRNGTFIVAGPRYRNGILVLPLTAKY